MIYLEETYEQALLDRFQPLPALHDEDIAIFLKFFKFYLRRGLFNLYQNMEITAKTIHFQTDPKTYRNLLLMSKDVLEYIADYHEQLVRDKLDIRNEIEEAI